MATESNLLGIGSSGIGNIRLGFISKRLANQILGKKKSIMRLHQTKSLKEARDEVALEIEILEDLIETARIRLTELRKKTFIQQQPKLKLVISSARKA